MSKREFVGRVVTTVVSLPTLFCIIYFLPHYNYLALSIVAIVATLFGCSEMLSMAFSSGEKPLVPFWLPTLLPIAQYMECMFFPATSIVDAIMVGIFLYVFAVEISKGAEDAFTGTLKRVSHTVFFIIYPAYFTTFIIKLLALATTPLIVLLFFALVLSNDLFAYVFGMLFGKNNRGILKVSPNKSIAGFVGGALASIGIGMVMVSFLPDLAARITLIESVVIGLVMAIAGTIGDLIESAFKRAGEIKDSGKLVPGRGGVLDSIDSIIASVPFFLLLIGQRL